MTIERKFKTIPSWLSDNFIESYGSTEYMQSKRTLIGKTLQRSMTDQEIIEELKPLEVTPSEIFDYLSSPEADKENWLLFYTNGMSCVVLVLWHAGRAKWIVSTWRRDDFGWLAGPRVFSPATDHFETGSSDSVTLESSDTLPEKITLNGVVYTRI